MGLICQGLYLKCGLSGKKGVAVDIQARLCYHQAGRRGFVCAVVFNIRFQLGQKTKKNQWGE